MLSRSLRQATPRRLLLSCFAFLAASSLTPACGGDSTPKAFDSTVALLDDFHFDVGPLPSSGPVKMSLSASATATAKVHLPAAASDAGGRAALYASGSGTVEVSGGFSLNGSLVVDIKGGPHYDGDIPGLADVSLPFTGTAAVDTLAMGAGVVVSAPIQPGDLPPIPLPGGLPGHLVLSVAEGSKIDVTLTGDCADIEGTTGEYHGSMVRGGTVVLAAKVVVDLPLGSKSFDVGSIPIAIPPSTLDVAAKQTQFSMEDAPAGASPAPLCTNDPGAGGAGPSTSSAGTDQAVESGSETTSSGASGETCTNDASCPSDQGCNAKGLCSPLLPFCVVQTVRVDDLALISGDREFDAHGPHVEVTVTPSSYTSGLGVDIHVKMTETQSNYSVGEATKHVNIPGDLDRVHGAPFFYSYDDQNHSLDTWHPSGDPKSLPVHEIRCMGDNDGEDICVGSSCSYCEVDLGCFSVTRS